MRLSITFLFTNLFEWVVHKYVMHRPVNIKGLGAVYERHTLNHHQFFTDDEMRFRDPLDWRVTVFPPYALVVFILMSIPAGTILGLLFSPNVGWLFMCAITGMYLIYEFMTSAATSTKTGSCATARSSTPCGAITPPTTMRG